MLDYLIHENEMWTVVMLKCAEIHVVLSLLVMTVCQAVERILHTSYVSVTFINVILNAVIDQLQPLCMYIIATFHSVYLQFSIVLSL